MVYAAKLSPDEVIKNKITSIFLQQDATTDKFMFNKSNITNSNFFWVCILFITASLIASCSRKNYPNLADYSFKSKDHRPDYSDLHYWAAHPWKWDPSDSIPKPVRNDHYKDSLVDVFFIHPTTLLDDKDNRSNADIDDSLLNIKTDYSPILYQSSVFNEKCRVFAPRYRQAHLQAFYWKDKEKSAIAFDTAYADVKNAFEYYLKNYNNGKPIIIASHSQGTLHAGKLLKEFFEGKELYKKLVCAYVIGMPIPEKYFSAIPPCQDATSTGCVLGWRTFKTGFTDTVFVARENFKAFVTNPLTWQMDTLYAPSSLNKGGVLKNFNKIKKGVVDAQVHGNVLWTKKPKFFGNILLRTKNYHIGDINLFYNNIRLNVRTRIQSYFNQ
jgi:hypothetical protein